MRRVAIRARQVRRHGSLYLNADLLRRADVSKTTTVQVEKGDLGMKTGRGLFQYMPEEAAALRQRRAASLVTGEPGGSPAACLPAPTRSFLVCPRAPSTS